MVIDTSALVAITQNEPEAPAFEQLIADDPVRLISAATVLEMRLGEPGGAEHDLWLARAAVKDEHADQARRAWRRYGTGRHPASLNDGYRFAYALVRLTDEPLRFKGHGFPQTDIRAAARANEH